MKQQTLIGVDIGTTSTKTVAFDIEGKVLFHYAIEYPIISKEPDHAEQDPKVVLQAVLDGLKIVVEQLHNSGYHLQGVSFSSAMHSLIVVDEQDHLLTNCLIWADSRSKEYATELKNSAIGHTIYLQTGTPLHPMSPLPKICWLRDHEPEVYRKAAKFIGIKEYVFLRLFGEHKVDYSIASATGLFNIFDLDWHTEALKIAGINEEQLSKPVPSTYTFHDLRPRYATYLNISSATPFVIGASDGCLANLGSNAVRPGDAVVTIGTSGAVRMMADKPATDLQERIFSYILTPERFVLGGAVNNGGVVLRWFRDNFFELETVAAREQNFNSYTLLNKMASTVPAGADGLLFLPYLLGERAPIWDASARGCFFGVHFNHTRAHFARAVMEGVIFGVYSVGKALEQTIGTASAIYANGGFARSELWVQMLADVFNIQVHITETPEGSAFGAAVMGMYALNMIDNLEEVEKMVTITKTFVPDQLNHQRYMKNFALFEELYPKLKGSFGK
ncbi:gluconokinase [Pontibacter silvestris]|uniref:Gluconokinase n=1 Tax=Pontibacter silvestris TaxID=2305183 RepID=A0ABW4X525_9BACT|nr:gluconokinase [Pontibacter silvestris]MCC9134818.1 gluconokinase [Pontibacter silvestris]